MNPFSRNEALIGESGQAALAAARVLIVGLGGVGGYALEMLVRSGIKDVTLVDMDRVELTNLNRQILALHSTLGSYKVEAAANRVKDVSPDACATALPVRFCQENCDELLSAGFDYCVDAIDSVKDKAALILGCYRLKIPCISAMGAGNRLNVRFSVKDIYQTVGDGLARAMRRILRAAGVTAHKCVCADTPAEISVVPPASISYAPALMGCTLAQEVIKDLLCR